MAKTEETDNEEKNNNNASTTHPANFRESAAFRRASFHPPEEIWNIFSEAEECRDVIDYFRAMVNTLNIDPNLHGKAFYDILTSKLTTWKCQSLWDLLNIKLKQNEYKQGKIGKDTKCLIIGAGPIGLRTAIEFLALGCKTVIVEKRKEFTRNNVLHLWPFLMTDFRELGAKKFYGKFGAGSIDHINIKTLQCILLKVALVLGLEIHVGVEFASLVEPTEENNVWRAVYEPENHPVSKYSFDVVIGADGKKNILPGFKQIELRGALAIGITCNFVNNNTLEEAKVPEISGVSFQFNPNFFKDMEEKYGVRLENIVYYKNETHYFVMTALKPSLIKCGVIKEDFSEPGKLLQSSNIDREKLIDYTLKAVNFSTNHILPDLQFKLLSNGNPDIALFDFTSIKKAANAARIIERHGQKLFLALVGDSLIEPFWPTGSGCGRGVLSALDVAWSVRQFSLKHPPLSILRERENVFKLLSGTSNDSLQKNYKAYTINPFTRYTAFDAKKVSNMALLKGLYDTDDIENANMTISSPTAPDSPKKVLRKRRSSGSTTPRKQHVTSSHIHQHTTPQAKTPKRRSAGVLKEQISVGNTKAFWEDHNKKNFEERSKEQVKKKEEDTVDEEDDEDDDSDIVEEKPVVKKGFAQQKSKDHKLKRQSSRDTLSPTEDQQPAVKKKIFVGLKHLTQEEKEEKKPKRKSLSKSKKRNDSSSGKSESLTKDKGAKKRESLEKKKKKSESSDVATCELPEKKNPPSIVDAASFLKKWLDDFIARFTTPGTNPAVDTSAHAAVLPLLAVPMLLDCNRAPRRRNTDLKLEEFKRKSVKKEQPEFRRNSSVKSVVSKFTDITEKDSSYNNYYDFLRKNSTKDQTGSSTPTELDTLLETDFEPSEVIDVEKALLATEEEERKRSTVSKKGVLGMENTLQLQLTLEEFTDMQTPLSALLMLQVIYNMHLRIVQQPSVEKFYRVYVKGRVFEKYVWLLEGSRDFFNVAGWTKCGNYLVLSKSYPVHQNLHVIEDVFRKKKRAQVAYSGSSTQHSRNKKPNVRRSRSHAEIREDSVLENFQREETPSDEEFGKTKLKRVKSIPHTLGEEEYIVVDFIGEIDVTSADTKPTAVVSDGNKSDELKKSDETLTRSPSVDSSFLDITVGDEPISDNKTKVATKTSLKKKSSITIKVEDGQPENGQVEESKSDYVVPVIANTSTTSTKKKFKAGKGLKKKAKDISPAVSVDNVAKIEITPASPTIKLVAVKAVKTIATEFSSPSKVEIEEPAKGKTSKSDSKIPVIRTSSSESSSGSLSRKASLDSSRRSLKVDRKEEEQGSIVSQNKFLFDQHYSRTMPRRVNSDRAAESRRPPPSVKRNDSDVDVVTKGTVQGARAMFESGATVDRNADERSSLRSLKDQEIRSLGLGKNLPSRGSFQNRQFNSTENILNSNRESSTKRSKSNDNLLDLKPVGLRETKSKENVQTDVSRIPRFEKLKDDDVQSNEKNSSHPDESGSKLSLSKNKKSYKLNQDQVDEEKKKKKGLLAKILKKGSRSQSLSDNELDAASTETTERNPKTTKDEQPKIKETADEQHPKITDEQQPKTTDEGQSDVSEILSNIIGKEAIKKNEVKDGKKKKKRLGRKTKSNIRTPDIVDALASVEDKNKESDVSVVAFEQSETVKSEDKPSVEVNEALLIDDLPQDETNSVVTKVDVHRTESDDKDDRLVSELSNKLPSVREPAVVNEAVHNVANGPENSIHKPESTTSGLEITINGSEITIDGPKSTINEHDRIDKEPALDVKNKEPVKEATGLPVKEEIMFQETVKKYANDIAQRSKEFDMQENPQVLPPTNDETVEETNDVEENNTSDEIKAWYKLDVDGEEGEVHIMPALKVDSQMKLNPILDADPEIEAEVRTDDVAVQDNFFDKLQEYETSSEVPKINIESGNGDVFIPRDEKESIANGKHDADEVSINGDKKKKKFHFHLKKHGNKEKKKQKSDKKSESLLEEPSKMKKVKSLEFLTKRKSNSKDSPVDEFPPSPTPSSTPSEKSKKRIPSFFSSKKKKQKSDLESSSHTSIGDASDLNGHSDASSMRISSDASSFVRQTSDASSIVRQSSDASSLVDSPSVFREPSLSSNSSTSVHKEFFRTDLLKEIEHSEEIML